MSAWQIGDWCEYKDSDDRKSNEKGLKSFMASDLIIPLHILLDNCYETVIFFL